VDYSRATDFSVLLYDADGGLHPGGLVMSDALRGSAVGGLDVSVDTADDVYSLVVRLLEPCTSAPSWLISRYAFSIRGAAQIRVDVGDTVVLNWVSS